MGQGPRLLWMGYSVILGGSPYPTNLRALSHTGTYGRVDKFQQLTHREHDEPTSQHSVPDDVRTELRRSP